MYRKPAECYRSCINKIPCCSYWLTLTSQWVIPPKAMVVYKGECIKLCACLRRPVTLCKLLILLLLMSSTLRIEQDICPHIDGEHSALVSHHVFAHSHKQYSLLISTPVRCWSVPIFIDFSLSTLRCIQAHHNESSRWNVLSLHSLQRFLSRCY